MYNEYRIFSYKNNFKWYNGYTCEYTDPYLETCLIHKKYKYKYPLFYEIKRTSIDEFKERSSMIDIRDINDYNIINNLKKNINLNLINLNKNLINININIIIYTPSLSFGGGNQFIINIYKILKSIGINVFIIPLKIEKIGKEKYNDIMNEDIYNINDFNIEFIKKYMPQYIIFNSDIQFNLNDIITISQISKIFFITHSDVAYSNFFVEKYNQYFNKIITVNKYTQNKLSNLLNINTSLFLKLINFTKIDINISKNNRKKNFGIISRFSEDKNIPMFIYSLIEIYKKYPSYKCYLIGCGESIYYDNYLIYLSKIFNLDNFLFFEGYQDNVSKYYEIFDFIVLPSVSEGCSYNIIEAMSLGIPVITSDVGGNHELIENEINGILYPYTGIKEFEEKTIYILNYNEQLLNIGYIINDENNKKKYKILNEFNKNNVLMPSLLSCNEHNYLNIECITCNELKNKNELFNKNKQNITNSIIKMIEYDETKINEIKNNNINFIRLNFNEYIYINQILELIR
jgi:glycosyltransferase involved in cell wall biosynthesis